MELEIDPNVARIFVALELSNSQWIVAIRLPGSGTMSLYQVPSGDLDGLMTLLAKARSTAAKNGFDETEACSCYEAGYDGFWLHRALVMRDVRNAVLDSASIKVSRRRKHVKTDRTDARGMLSVLMALYRGEDDVCSVVRVPSEEEEDRKRITRSRESLLHERVRHTNRIRGLLNLQGIRSINPNLPGWEQGLKGLRTADGRPFPRLLMREIRRESVMLATVKRLLSTLNEEIQAISQKKTRRRTGRGANPVAVRLCALRGIGPQTAAVFASEVFYRSFRNQREIASYVGLSPTPYASGGYSHDQGISKAGNRRARRDAIELSWLWLRHQPNSALSQWYQRRVNEATGRVRRIAIAALARRLMIALWHYLEHGVIPEGAIVRA